MTNKWLVLVVMSAALSGNMAWAQQTQNYRVLQRTQDVDQWFEDLGHLPMTEEQELPEAIIYWPTGQTDIKNLDPATHAMLRKVGENLKLAPKMRLEIQGHTDSTGSKKDNLWLSYLRAQSVNNFLVEYGIDAKRLIVIPFGEEHPFVQNDNTANAKALNRRVQFRKR